MASGLKAGEMPERWCRIIVVCEHVGRPYQGRRRVIDRIRWAETDPEDEADMRAAVEAEGLDDERAIQIILMHERFVRAREWTSNSGRVIRPGNSDLSYPAGEESSDRAEALAGFRFKCACGIDRPVRESTLDSWIRDRLASDPSRRVHEFEISH